MFPLRLFLADDHEIVRYGLRMLLESQPGWTVVGEAANGRDAVQGVLATEPDVTLLDIGMPGLNGLEVAREISALGSKTRVLIVSVHDSDDIVRAVVDSGAQGYVLKSDAARDLVAAVEAVQSDETFFTPRTAEVILERQLKRMQSRAKGSPLGKKRGAHP